MNDNDLIYSKFESLISNYLSSSNDNEDILESDTISQFLIENKRFVTIERLKEYALKNKIKLKSNNYNKIHLIKLLFLKKYEKVDGH